MGSLVTLRAAPETPAGIANHFERPPRRPCSRPHLPQLFAGPAAAPAPQPPTAQPTQQPRGVMGDT